MSTGMILHCAIIVTLQLEFAKNEKTPSQDWQKVNDIFTSLIHKIEQAQNSQDMQWLDLLGSPCKELILSSGQDKGIPGILNGQLGDILRLNLTLKRDPSSTNNDWLTIMHHINAYVEQLYAATKNTNFESCSCFKQLGESLQTLLETPNLDKSLCITFNDQEGYSLYMYFGNKN